MQFLLQLMPAEVLATGDAAPVHELVRVPPEEAGSFTKGRRDSGTMEKSPVSITPTSSSKVNPIDISATYRPSSKMLANITTSSIKPRPVPRPQPQRFPELKTQSTAKIWILVVLLAVLGLAIFRIVSQLG